MLRIIIAASALAVAGIVLTGLAAAALGSAKAAAKWPSAGKSIIGPLAARIGVVVGIALVSTGVAMATWLVPVGDQLARWGIVAGAVLASAALVSWGAVAVTAKIELSTLINSPFPPRDRGAVAVTPHAPPPNALSWTPTTTAEHEIVAPVNAPSVSPESLVGQAPYPPVVDSHSTTSQREDAATRPDVALTGARPPAPSDVEGPRSDVPDSAIPDDALPGWVYVDAVENWYLVLSTTDGNRLMRLADFALIPVGALGPEDLTIAGSIEMTVWPLDSVPPVEDAPSSDDTTPDEDATPVGDESVPEIAFDANTRADERAATPDAAEAPTGDGAASPDRPESSGEDAGPTAGR